MRIYVGNLSFDASEDDLKQAFAPFGEVASITIIRDKFTDRCKGFGFVEMPQAAEAQAAIAGLNGKTMMNRALTVNEAQPPRERSGGGPGGGRGGRGPGGGGGGGRRGGGGGGGGGNRRW
jgi:RNA recognition motif-containing protein